MTDARRPIHLAVLGGATVGVYAASLAVVTALQSAADARAMDARAPLDVATRSMAADHDELDRRLDLAESAYGTLAAAYDRARPTLDGVDSSLDRLSGAVSAVSGSARSLPDRVALPSIAPTIVTRASTSAHVTTGASGH